MGREFVSTNRASLWRKLVLTLTGLALLVPMMVLAAPKPAAAQSGNDTTMLLFDLSGSMSAPVINDGRSRLAVAQQSMIDAINGLEPGSKNIGIRTFSDCGVSTLEAAPGPVDAAALTATISSFRATGLTDIALALDSIAGDLAGITGRPSVILLSDGADNCGGDPCQSATDLIAGGIDVIVHAIGIGTDGTAAQEELECIAEITGGTVISVDEADELFEAIDSVIDAGPTSAIIRSATAICINSPQVQNNDAIGSLQVGDEYEAGGRLLVITTGEACGFDCQGGFDVLCDDSNQFCDSKFDRTTVFGVGKCLEDLAKKAEPPTTDRNKIRDALLERYCVANTGSNDPTATRAPAMREACDAYRLAVKFLNAADDALADGKDPFFVRFNRIQGEEELDRARAAFAKEIADREREGAEYETALAAVTGDWSQIPGGDPAKWSDDELRLMLETIDINFDRDVIALKTAQGVPAVLDFMPDWMQAELFNAGREIELSVTPLSASVPLGPFALLSPVNASGQVSADLATKLTEPQPGVGFTSTQKFEVTAQARIGGQVTGGRPPLLAMLAKIDKRAQQIGMSSPLEAVFGESRLLKGIIKSSFSVEYDQFIGSQMKWETVVSEERARVGARDLPNPYDPASFDIGDSVFIRGGEIEGTMFAVNFKLKRVPLRLQGDTLAFSGTGWGITRLDANRYAVISGPVEAFEATSFFGLNSKLVLGVFGKKEAAFSQFEYAELNLATGSGQDAFFDFANGSGVPQFDRAGVRTADISEIAVENSNGFKLQLGPVSVADTGYTTGAVRTEANYFNGQDEITTVYNYPDAQIVVVAPQMANGDPDLDEGVFTFLMTEVSDSRASTGALALGVPEPVGKKFDVQITMTGADIQEMRERVQAHFAANPAIGGPLSFTEEIGDAESIEETFYVMANLFGPNTQDAAVLPDRLGNTLGDITPRGEEWVPFGGTIEFRPVP